MLLILGVAGFIITTLLALAGWFFARFYNNNEKQNEALNKLSISMEKLVVTLDRNESESKHRHEDVQTRITDNHEYMMAQFKIIYAEQTLGRKRYHDQQNLFTHIFLKMGLDEKAKEIEKRLKEENDHSG